VTTSVRDSGLLDELVLLFTERSGVRVEVIAVGTGQALKLGRGGDADAILCHDRAAEVEFLSEGAGSRHVEVMESDFLLAGPDDDPAGARGCEIAEALQRIRQNESMFLSRDDDSGTHRRELQLWEQAGGPPDGPQYLECGRGMGATLIMAGEKRGYVLVDRGTFLQLRDKHQLVALVDRGSQLRNPYGALAVNADRHPAVARQEAQAFLDFLISPEAQRYIGAFAIFGQRVFRPSHETRTD
jgi:tungstate transport system substrate-binding protein